MLINAGFEGGWTRKTHAGQEFGEIFVPEGWTAFWREGGTVPHDPGNTNGYSRPEMHVINREAPFLDPPRIRSGNRSVKLFTFFRIHDAGLYQRVPVACGARLRVAGWAHAWTSTQDDPRVSEHSGDAAEQATFRVGIDPGGGTDPWGESVIWGPGASLYDVYGEIPAVEAVALGDAVTVFVRSVMRYPFKHCDAYLDDMNLEAVAEPPTPEPGPAPGGYPAMAMVVDYGFIAAPARRQELYALACQRGIMVGPSHDHVRAWPPGAGSYTVELYDVPEAKRAALRDYYAQSPEIVVEFRGQTPAEPPTPPGGGEALPFELRSDNLIGLHSGFVRAQTRYYMEKSGTTAQKFFSAGDCYLAKQWAPDCLMIWRKFVNELPYGAIVDQATWYATQYALELASASSALGITVDQLLAAIAGMEGYNEMIPSHNETVVKYAVAFDVAFADALRTLFGDEAHPVLLNGAVGNPHESEVPLLLPAARAAVKYGGYLGYHSYWPANLTRTWVGAKWQWFAGRWQEWDTVFVAAGVYPRYISTESGICYSPDGQWLDPASGWKKAGSFERYLADISEYNRRCLEWNKAHANRFAGMTLFGYGNWGWDSFELGDGEVLMLNEWATNSDPQRLAMLVSSMRVSYWDEFDEDDYRADLLAYLDSATYISPEYREKLQEGLR